MVRLICNDKYVDLPKSYAFEIKSQHPISQGLSHVYMPYSTDIQLDLTSNNVEIFDYSLLRETSQVHRTLEGFLIKNAVIIAVDIVVKRFTKRNITIYIEERVSEPIRELINGKKLNSLPYEDFLQYDVGRIDRISDSTELFSFYEYDTQEYLAPSIRLSSLLGKIDDYSNINISTGDIDTNNIRVIANRFKSGEIKNYSEIEHFETIPTNQGQIREWALQTDILLFAPNNLRNNEESILNTTSTRFSIYAKEAKSITVRIKGYVYHSDNILFLRVGIKMPGAYPIFVNYAGENSFDRTITFTPTSVNTDISIIVDYEGNLINSTEITANLQVFYEYTEDIGKEISMLPEKNFIFDCWKNLPDITILDFLKAIALTNGYTLKLSGTDITFQNLSYYFSIDNAIDASEYFLGIENLDFVFLKYQKNNIRYGKDTPPYATIVVNDNTLQDEGDFLVVENVLPTDDYNVQLWDYSDPEKPKIREGLATVPFQGINMTTYNNIAQYLDSAYVYEGRFKNFEMTGQPLYIKQLNGYYLPTEIIERVEGNQSKEIKTKLLKL